MYVYIYIYKYTYISELLVGNLFKKNSSIILSNYHIICLANHLNKQIYICFGLFCFSFCVLFSIYMYILNF